jgi:hypothetical protein
VSGKTPDEKELQSTLDDLPSVQTDPMMRPLVTSPILEPVDTSPVLKPVATVTLDEDPAPSTTQLLEPVQDAVTDLKLRRPAVKTVPLGDSAPTQPRKRREPDAFESAPTLRPAREPESGRGAPAWQKSAVWTPWLIALTVTFVVMVLLGIFLMLRSW